MNDRQLDLQDQEAKIKMLVQAKIEPVDIREVDEDQMNWTLNDSFDREDLDTENSHKHANELGKKK